VETLPSELDGIATEIHVNFPWGSLLRAVAGGDEIVLRNLRQLCAADALLTVVLGLDVERDRSELDRLALPSLDVDYLRLILPTKYARAGFEIVRTETLAHADVAELKSSWARRLKAGPNRSFIRIVARAVEGRRSTLWAL
jgi:16S rRNA (adenine(1408)-N(1))-methyltransferase